MNLCARARLAPLQHPGTPPGTTSNWPTEEARRGRAGEGDGQAGATFKSLARQSEQPCPAEVCFNQITQIPVICKLDTVSW